MKLNINSQHYLCSSLCNDCGGTPLNLAVPVALLSVQLAVSTPLRNRSAIFNTSPCRVPESSQRTPAEGVGR